MNPVPNQKMIADRAGVSTAAVSYVLRGRPGVADATRQKILAIAEEMGYRPDPLNSALAESRWRKADRKASVSLAFLSGERTVKGLAGRNPGFAHLQEFAAKLGYFVTPYALGSGVSVPRLTQQLRAISTRGVFIDRFFPEQSQAAELMQSPEMPWPSFAWVAISEGIYAPHCHRILNNTFRNVTSALEQLLAHGYRRIAFVHEATRFSRDNERQQAAFLYFRAEHPEVDLIEIPVNDQQVIRAEDLSRCRQFQPDTLLLGYSRLNNWLPPDLAALPYASLACWDQPEPVIAGIQLSADDMAKTAIDMMDFQIRRSEYGLPERRQTMLIDGLWRDGHSLPRR